MKSFNQIAESMSPRKPLPKKRYRKPPTPINKNVKKDPKCRVAPLVVVMYPDFLDMPRQKYTEDTKQLLRVIYSNLLKLKKRLLIR